MTGFLVALSNESAACSVREADTASSSDLSGGSKHAIIALETGAEKGFI